METTTGGEMRQVGRDLPIRRKTVRGSPEERRHPIDRRVDDVGCRGRQPGSFDLAIRWVCIAVFPAYIQAVEAHLFT